MLSTKLILEKIGQDVVERLRYDIKNKSLVKGFPPPNASGDLEKNLRYEATETSLKVYALDYIYYLEHGRKAGKKPPRAVIRKWIDDKGILPKADEKGRTISKDSLAFLIQRKIGNNGTLIAQQGGSDLLSSIINDEFISNIKDELTFSIVEQIKSEIINIAA